MVILRIFKYGVRRIQLLDSNSRRFASSGTAHDNPVVRNAPPHTRFRRAAEDKNPADPLFSQFPSCADCMTAMT